MYSLSLKFVFSHSSWEDEGGNINKYCRCILVIGVTLKATIHVDISRMGIYEIGIHVISSGYVILIQRKGRRRNADNGVELCKNCSRFLLCLLRIETPLYSTYLALIRIGRFCFPTISC